ncbi:uncharacterized protein LOC130637777 [Hydractinia symbiolongicarpus]|uniref:uncharacterized protein LOC130637777 n=1 Tax=Hydractinia symbiolongicarpus TaxID=13093 RepID=UPI00254AF5B6|nr:uncharacterized protein LOC130637777 [Hydractinia symbiolongicarpus]
MIVYIFSCPATKSSQFDLAKKLPTPPIRFTVSNKKKPSECFSIKRSLAESVSPVICKQIMYVEDSPMLSPSEPNTPRSPLAANPCSSSSSSTSKKPSKSNEAACNKDKYPLPEVELQRKVLLGISEILNLLRNNRTTGTSHDNKKCLSEEEFETLERKVKEDKTEFKNLVDKVSNIGGSSERECTKNILLM